MKDIKLRRHVFYCPVSLDKYEIGMGNIVVPLEFSGRLEIHRDHRWYKGMASGFFTIEIPYHFDCFHLTSVVDRISMDEMRRIFIHELWSNSFLQNQLMMLYFRFKNIKDNQEYLVEEF